MSWESHVSTPPNKIPPLGGLKSPGLMGEARPLAFFPAGGGAIFALGPNALERLGFFGSNSHVSGLFRDFSLAFQPYFGGQDFGDWIFRFGRFPRLLQPSAAARRHRVLGLSAFRAPLLSRLGHFTKLTAKCRFPKGDFRDCVSPLPAARLSRLPGFPGMAL